jgi:hypothetical protein
MADTRLDSSMVEQLTLNQLVSGSSPDRGTFNLSLRRVFWDFSGSSSRQRRLPSSQCRSSGSPSPSRGETPSPCLPCVPLSHHAVYAPFVMNLLLTLFFFAFDFKNSYDGRNQLTESAAVSTSIGRRDI